MSFIKSADDIIACFNEAIFICTPTGRVVQCNSSASRLFNHDQHVCNNNLVDWLARHNQPFAEWFHLTTIQTGIVKGNVNVPANNEFRRYITHLCGVRDKGATQPYAVMVRFEPKKRNMDFQFQDLKQHMQQMNQHLKIEYRHAHQDELTGLYNRRHFYSIASRSYNHLVDVTCSGCLVMLDIDNFKRINDLYGHDIGDVVLVQVASILASCSREDDIPTRWGGEEFMLFLRDISITDALDIIDRIRASIEQQVIKHHGADISVTVSIGVCALLPSLDETIKCCDSALYQAKNNGKNTAVVYQHN